MRLNVLVADATAVGRQHAAFLLEKRGHTVQSAATADELDARLASPFDLILIHLPFAEADAATFARAVRRRAAGAALVALAAAPAAGFDETLIAPLQPLALDAALQTLTRPIVDVPRLMQLVGGNRDLLRQMVELLDPTVESALTGMKAAIEAGDAMSLAGMAHRLKGSLGNLAADAAVAAARTLEGLGKGGDLNEARAALAKLGAVVRRMRGELQTILARSQ